MSHESGKWPDWWSDKEVLAFCEECIELELVHDADEQNELVRSLAWEVVREGTTLRHMADWLAHADEAVHLIYELTYKFTEYQEWVESWGIFKTIAKIVTLPTLFRLRRELKQANDHLLSRFRKWLDIYHPDRIRRTDLDNEDPDGDCLCDDESNTNFKAIKKQ